MFSASAAPNALRTADIYEQGIRMGQNRRSLLKFAVAGALAMAAGAAAAQAPRELRIDYATYNPVSLVLKDRKLLESAFEKDGIRIRWVQSLGSNKALEFLNAS